MATIKEKLWEELQDKARILVDGIRVEDEVLRRIGAGTTVKEGGRTPTPGLLQPSYFTQPSGLNIGVQRNPESHYAIEWDNGEFIVTRDHHKLYPVTFPARPKYYEQLTSDGKPMKDIVSIVTHGCAAIWYSNECAYKDRGEDCLFCNINALPGNIFLKSPKQIAESVAAAFREGVGWRIDFTGGVIPERREIEYYTDAIEAIQDELGRTDLIAAACIAGPGDLNNIERLKEAGFSIITMNIELWDKHMFKTICPGKERTIGWDNWLKALEYGAKVFGFGQVRCNFVAGIEPKHKTLEGLEYLADKGVVGNVNIFRAQKGTPLAGHRTPEWEWHLDLHEKAAKILMRSGITLQQAVNCHPQGDSLFHDVWRIEEEALPVFQNITA